MAYKLQSLRSGATAHPEHMMDFFSVKMVDQSGVVNLHAGELQVVQKPAPTLHVLVQMGAAFLKKADGSMVYPVNLENEDAELAITANASGNPRIDAVVLYLDLAQVPNTDATNVAILTIVEGSSAATPVSPADSMIQSAVGAANPFVRLGNVTVANGETSIEDADIEDARTEFIASDTFNQEFELGDVKMSTKDSVAGRWMHMNAQTIGDTSSGANNEGFIYKRLFDHLVDVVGLIPSDTWENGGTVALPDSRDRFAMGAGSTYGIAEAGGVEEITIANHVHTIAHTHTHTHTHTISHTHSYPHTHMLYRHSTQSSGAGLSNSEDYHGITYSQSTSTTGGASTGSSGGASTSTTSGSSVANSGSNGGFTQNIVNKYFGVNYFIKY